LSITIYCKAENKFSFLACQAHNPSNHKAFPRLHAREVIGKYFPLAHNSGVFRRIKSQAIAARVRAKRTIIREESTANRKQSTTKQAREAMEGRKEGRNTWEGTLGEGTLGKGTF
jgi:hypothetical protein